VSNINTFSAKRQNDEAAYDNHTLDNNEIDSYESLEGYVSEAKEGINYKEFTDEELVKLYLEREDEPAFNEIVDRYGWKIHSLAFRITHDMRNADDILQDVFMIIVEKIHTFRQEAKFSTWLYRVSVNASLQCMKQQKIQDQGLSLDDMTSYDNNGYLRGAYLEDWSCIPERVAINRENKETIEKAISEIPYNNRVAFHLCYLDNLSHKEIGNILGITLPAVKSRVRRAKLFLKARLSENLCTASNLSG